MITFICRAPLPALHKRQLRRAVAVALKCLHRPGSDIAVVFCGTACIRKFNARFLNRNRATDVIAFGDDKRYPGYERTYLGDIVVSVERARQQALALGHSTKKELLILIIHGILHLLGYDDDVPRRKRIMFRKQDAVVKAIERKIRLRV